MTYGRNDSINLSHAAAALAASVLICAAVLSLLPIWGEQNIYDDVLRLHVIAESDSSEDQRLKLMVRDAVLACVSEKIGDADSFDEAYEIIEDMQGDIKMAAEAELRSNNCTADVDVSLGRERYPRRDYGSAVLPAGEYTSLRVTLGRGEGHNWWCVLFPTVCMRFSETAEADEYIAAGFTPEEYRIITGDGGRIKVKFRILELLSGIIGG